MSGEQSPGEIEGSPALQGVVRSQCCGHKDPRHHSESSDSQAGVHGNRWKLRPLCPQKLTDASMGFKTKNRFIQVQGQLQVWLSGHRPPKATVLKFRLKHKAQHLQFENLKDRHQSLLKSGLAVPPGVICRTRAREAVRVCEPAASCHLECFNVTKPCPSTCSEEDTNGASRPPLAVPQGSGRPTPSAGTRPAHGAAPAGGRLRASPQMHVCSPRDLAAKLASNHRTKNPHRFSDSPFGGPRFFLGARSWSPVLRSHCPPSRAMRAETAGPGEADSWGFTQ